MTTTICHYTIVTRDLAGTSQFFEAALGWRRIPRATNIPVNGTWHEVAPGEELHVVELADFSPPQFEREYGRHIALAVPVAEFPALKQRLTKHGAEVMTPDRPTPFERFFFRDPNGYLFEVVEADHAPEEVS